MTDNEIDDTGMEDAADTAAMPPEIDADATESAPEGDGTIHADDIKWRKRFRETEAQLAVELARVSELNRAEIQRLAAVGLEDPADLFLDGTTPAELCGEDGLVDPQLVAEKVAEVVAAHPHWARTKPVVGVPASVVHPLATQIPGGTTQPTWADLLGGNKIG